MYLYISFITLLAMVMMRSEAVSSSPPPHHEQLIDLGYAKHVPTYINTTSSGLNISIYKNIRYARPPIGKLRFRKPDARLRTESGIQDGRKHLDSSRCIATVPWYIPPQYVPPPYSNGTTIGSEDCLFLDVFVPEGVKEGDGVPVLHYYIGSGLAYGDKDVFSNPMGLFDYMHSQHDAKFIYVVHNYRLGVLGWLAAAAHNRHDDLDMNVGLWDSLTASEWTAKYIGKFGGDRKRISVMGNSAGASLLYYSTVLNDGKWNLPYQQSFISSPAAPPRRNVTERLNTQFQTILSAANCTSIRCMRSLSENQIKQVNHKVLNDAYSDGGGGTLGPGIGFGPIPDGKYVTDIPMNLLRTGKFNKKLKRIVVGTMAREGLGTSPDQDMPARFPTIVRKMFPGVDNATVASIQSGYSYPADYPDLLAQDWMTDVVFACPAHSLASAFGDRAYRYIMSTPPAVHGLDQSYLFYIDPHTTPVTPVDLARTSQRKLLDYIHGRDMEWPLFGHAKHIYNITNQYEATLMSDNLQKRCGTIDKVILDPMNQA